MGPGTILIFPKSPHARASAREIIAALSRAASIIRMSAVNPACDPVGELTIGAHHSEGMASRCHHLLTELGLAPTSAAMASREGQSSITERNEFMTPSLGQSVLKSKANLSLDAKGRNVLQSGMGSRPPSAVFKEAFTDRVKAAREATGRTQQQMADALGIAQDRYKQYEGRTLMPHELIPLFCNICQIDVAYLFTGRRITAAQPKRKFG